MFAPGPLNAITDVAGVRVGHTTLITGDDVRTGVTVIVPHGGNVFQDKVPGAVFVGNAFGKLAGSTQVDELGTIETPIALTNTLRVGAVVEGLVRWTLDSAGQRRRALGERARRRDQRRRTERHSRPARPAAITCSRRSPRRATARCEEGSVGAGTGTRAFGWKGGIGTSSRRLEARYGGYTVGVLVQTQLRRRADDGRRAGGQGARALFVCERGGNRGQSRESRGRCQRRSRRRLLHDRRRDRRAARCARSEASRRARGLRPGAHRIVVQQRQRRLCDRVLDRGGSARRVANDAAPQPRTLLPTEGVSPLFQAALEATEEAVYNSLLESDDGEESSGDRGGAPGRPVKEILQKYRVTP